MEATHMKKARKSKLHVEREILRALQVKELRHAGGGGAIPVSVIDRCPPPPITGDSKRECCV
jgi:hypothetical protein